MTKVSSDFLDNKTNLLSKNWRNSLSQTEQSQKSKWIVRLFNGLRIMADPVAYSNDRSAKIADMIDHRIEFFLVHDINRDLTKEQKIKWFGAEIITPDNITWG